MRKILLFGVLLFSYIYLNAQTTVSGTVVDELTGEELPGVTVLIEGTQLGTAADINGAFNLLIPDTIKKPVLAFSMIGYKPQKVEVGGRKVIRVTMEEDLDILKEVVVVGSSIQQKGSVIGAVESVNVKDLAQPTRTLSTSLAGRVSGVIAIQNTGEPGYDNADFWIRGINTFTGNKSPLVLVDGIERTMDDIDPQEIASMTALKDAAATAEYGVRGGNGVIVITTKKGLVGKPIIKFRAEMGMSNPQYMPEFADGPTYMKIHNEALRNMGKQDYYTPLQIERTENGYDPYYYPNVNWLNALTKNLTPSYRANLTVQGGSESVRYFVSAGFLDQNGMFKKFDEGVSFNNNINAKRYNFRTSVDANLTKTTLLGISIASILEDRNYPAVGTQDIFNNMYNIPPTKYPLFYPDKKKVPQDGQYKNPYQQLARSGYTTENHITIQSNLSLSQKLDFITEGLQFAGTFSFDNYTTGQVKRTMNPRPYMIVPWAIDENEDPILLQDGEYNYKDQDEPGQYSDYLSRQVDGNAKKSNRSIYIEGKLAYNRSFGDHRVSGLVLYNQSDYQDIMTGDLYESIPRRFQGLSTKIGYDFQEKYYGEVNVGYNGSESFAKGNRYGVFPAFAVGWVPTNESFMKFLIPTIDYMKVRASYGEVGNGNLSGRFVYLTRVENGSGGNFGFGVNNGGGFGSGKGTAFTYYGNPEATWETAKKFDIGVELNFLKNFSLNIDYFHERREDIWDTLDKTPDVLGFNQKKPGANIGEMTNKGIDGFIEFSKKINTDLFLSFRGTFVYARNEIIKHGKAPTYYEYQDQKGYPNESLLGYLNDGYFIDEADVANHPDQSAISGVAPKPGDLKYKDYNEDGVVDQFDRVYMGHPKIPEITYGLNGFIQYKNIDLAFLFQGASNVSFFAAPKLFSTELTTNVYTFMLNDYWSEETQNLNARFPRLGTGTQDNNYVNSDHWLHDGKYLRLKTIELGYNLSNTSLRNVGINKIRLFANGNNLFTISPFDWWDPEPRRGSGSFYGIQRIFNFGAEITF